MEPNDLKAALDKAGDKRAALEVLNGRTDTIIELFQLALKNFLAEPTCYHPDFNLFHLARQKPHAQQRYYKRAAASLLIAATEAVRVGEAFHLKERVKAAKKAGYREGVQIPGVKMPDLGPGGVDLEALCQCGHTYGHHTAETEGFCMDMDCECQKFTPKEGATQP